MLDLQRTQRVERLRDRLINTEPIICAERAVIWTDVYKRNEDKPPIIKAALALDETLRKMSIEIYDDELIIGNQGSALRATTISPTVNTWIINELDKFEQRDGSRFLISEEVKQQIREIIPYWEGRNVYDSTIAMLDQRTIDAMDALVFTCGYTLSKGCGHWLLNFETVLKIGFKGIKAAAQAKLDQLDYTNPAGFEQIPLYQAIIITCDAVNSFARRYSKLALEKAAQENDPVRRAELERIAGICARVPYEAPETFYEALQTVYFIQLITHIESDGTGISLGRMDYYLYPFYLSDLKAGKIDKTEAGELLDCLWLKIACIIQVWNEEDSKAFGGHPISQAVTLGGMDAEGNDATNELSYMMLETTARVHMPQPSVCVRVSRSTPDRFLAKSVEVIREGLGMPALFNDEIAIPSLVSRGIGIDEAREYYGVIGCVEMGLQGRDCAFANSGYFNLVKALEIMLNNGTDPVSGKKLGIETGNPADFETFEQFYDAYIAQMKELLAMQVAVTNVVDAMHPRVLPLPFVTAITDDCIETGKEVQSGGARHNFEGVQGVGLADIADSFAAIRKLVFEEKKLTMQQILDALRANYEGYEKIRNMLLKDAPAYGNNNPYVDQIARKVTRDFCEFIGKHKNPRGGCFIPGMYSNSANVPLGSVCGASPNGRLAFKPVAEACSPSHGKEKNGPTQAALSVASLDHVLMTNGSQYNQKFHPTSLAGDTGINAMADLVRTYFEAGGYHMQFNVVSSDTLREAQKNPGKYKDLVVRVAGYTAFFIDLNREIQDDIIDRTELGFAE
jgi:formate C-acetyltransferase